MRKSLLLLFSCSIASLGSVANIIDSLNTNEQVLSFVRSLDKHYKNVFIIPPKPIERQSDYILPVNAFQSKVFEKIDLDNNGQTDILFNGYIDYYAGNSTCNRLSIMIFAFPDDSFTVKELIISHHVEFFAARILRTDSISYLNIEEVTMKPDANGQRFHPHLTVDTLACLFNEFIEKSKPNNLQIEKIEFCAWGGLGTFSDLKLVIKNDEVIMESRSTMHPPLTAIDSGGVFKSSINSPVYSKLIGLTRHIDFMQLKPTYSVAWTDGIEAGLKITYKDGKVKKINDYGLVGTRALASFQRFLLNLRYTLQWKLIERKGDFFAPFCDN